MRIISTVCLSAFALLASAGAAARAAEDLDYAAQDKWVGVLDQRQSPIDIVTSKAVGATASEPRSIDFWHARRALGKVEDTGHAVQFDTSTIQALIRGRHFQLTQLHLHNPSEHTIDGRHFALEAHLVFKAQNGALAVVAVMYEAGKHNAAVQTLLDGLADTDNTKEQQVLDVDAMLPPERAYHHYLGSLTTPPLTQNVEWYVLKQPVALGADQLEVLRKRHMNNNRKLQPLNGRPLIDSDD